MVAAATTEGVGPAEGVEAGAAEATRETALVDVATRGATPKVAVALSRAADLRAASPSPDVGTRAITSNQGSGGAVEGIKGGEGAAARCSRCARTRGARPPQDG